MSLGGRGVCSRVGLLMVLWAMMMQLAHAQQEVDVEWPCIQVLVPKVVPAVVWPELIPEAIAETWRQDRATQKLARDLAALDEFTDEHRGWLEQYAAQFDEGQRLDELNRLAYGIVLNVNHRRNDYIRGIRKFTRQQIAIAGQIEDTLNSLAEDDASGTDGQPDAASREEIMNTLRWHERLYDQRERVIRALCDRPVELESMLGEITRELSYHLP